MRRTLAIVEDLKPHRLVARESLARVRAAQHRTTNRPAASVSVNQKRASQVLTPGLRTPRAMASALIVTLAAWPW
jgi:hypothetical protein